MEHTEVMQLLRDSLTIEVEDNSYVDYGRESRSVTVKLLLDGKVISSDTVSL